MHRRGALTNCAWDVPRSTEAAANLIEVAVTVGIGVELCLHGAGLKAADVARCDMVINARQELRIVRNLIAEVGDSSTFALRAGLRYRLSRAGFLGMALLASDSLGDAIALGLRFSRLTSVFPSPSLEVDTHTAAIVLDDRAVPADVRRFLVERDAAAIVGLTPALLGASSPPGVRVSLRRRSAAGDLDALDGVADVEYGAQRNAIVFPSQLLSRRLPAANPGVARQSISLCDDLLRQRQGVSTIATRVHQRLARDPSTIPLMRTLANELGTTERTLRRRLAREGTSYRLLLDQVRENVAADLLAGGASVQQAAQRLGYSEPAAFHHAFARWHDVPPGRWSRV